MFLIDKEYPPTRAFSALIVSFYHDVCQEDFQARIDDFTRVNDRYGHLEGSRVIAQMGALLREELRTRSTDSCFRYAEKEFSIVLGETGSDMALKVAERVRKSVENYPFTFKSLHPFEVLTVSLGVSTRRKEDNKTIPGLIQESDVALYRAKALGKNQVIGYDPTLTMPGAKLAAEHRAP